MQTQEVSRTKIVGVEVGIGGSKENIQMRILKISLAAAAALAFLLFSTPLLAGKGGGGGFDTASSSQLTDIEIEYLLFMREEEKLARDVYIVMYEEWGIPVFNNISKSEQSHMDAMKVLLDKYGLKDPVGDNGVGEFKNEDLQSLYEDLVALGSQTSLDGLEVGGLIEEVDIEDIAVAIENTDRRDIQRTYESLLCGSRNHLRGFSSLIVSMTGAPYEVQWTAAAGREDFTDEEWEDMIDSIIDSPMERCGRGGR